MSNNFSVIIMAAGKGTRMAADKPKVLLECGGKPIICRVVEAAMGSGSNDVIVMLGHQHEAIEEALREYDVRIVLDHEVNGTGLTAYKGLKHAKNEHALVINGDHPLVVAESINRIINEFGYGGFDSSIVTWEIPDAGRYGRVVRNDQGLLKKIVEAVDCTPEQLGIKEYNVGTYLFDVELGLDYLKRSIADKTEGEHYITDIFEMMVNDGLSVGCILGDELFSIGVNTPEELAEADRIAAAKGL